MIASLITLGCKVNEYESESMATQLKNAGYQVVNGLNFADIYIVNTCAVTNTAEKKSRQYIAKILKVNPNAKIVVCGCASQNDYLQFKSDSIICVFGSEGKHKITELINQNFKQNLPIENCYSVLPYATNFRVRQFVKIQDGCDYFCSYCLIPYLRGRSRSRDLNDILSEIKLSQSAEIVLTGINMSDYKIENQYALQTLIEQVDKLGRRFRISSLEVNVITDEMIILLKNAKNFCPHFHISLQSACNDTLKRMNRRYTIEQFASVLQKIKLNIPNCCISTDIIAGFKGETKEEFENTYNNLKNLPLDFMHIFPYSERKGTAAEKFENAVDKNIILNRVNKLAELNKNFKAKFFKNNIDTKHKVLIEAIKDNYACGYSENYIYTYIKNVGIKVGEVGSVMLKSNYKDGMLGEII